MVVLDQVLEEVHAFFGLDLVDFDQVLRNKEERRFRVGQFGPILKGACEA